MICAKKWLSFEGISNIFLNVWSVMIKCCPSRWLHFMQNHSWKQFYNISGGKSITPFGPWEPIWAGPLLMIVQFYSSSLYLFFVGTMSDDLAYLSPIFHLNQPSPIIFYPLFSKWRTKQGFGDMINVNGWWNLLVLVPWLSTTGWCWWWGICLW